MKYWIETERYVALTCALTEWQADKFLNSIKTNKSASCIILNGAEGQALVVFSHKGALETILVDPQDREERLRQEAGNVCGNRDDAKLWDNIKLLDDFFRKNHYVISVKIFPESAIPDDVPNDFIRKKQIHHKDIRDKEKTVCPVIADYLQRAARIRNLYKNRPETESTPPPEQNHSNSDAPVVEMPPVSNPPTSSRPKGTRQKRPRTLWVRKQIDMRPPKSDKQIFEEWNQKSDSERATLCDISETDPDRETRKLYERFKHGSNITRIRDAYELEKERQNTGK